MKRRLLSIIIMFSAVLFPLLLLHKSNYGFYFDWYNHLWLIGYFGEYFRQHMEMPTVINSIQYVNVTYNIFYGYLFYPLVGLFSSFLGANLAVRFFALILYLIQYIAVFSLIKRISNNHWVGMAIACLSVWAVYPLTNLYNRSALTEIFAVTCLTIALCLWIHSLFVSDLFQKISMRICFATALVMAMGFHPITALYGGSFISIVIIATIPYIIKQKKYTSDIFSGIGIILFIVAVVFPWFYATTGHMEGIFIQNTAMQFFEGVDELFVRFSPFPLDMRSITGGTSVSTPYLDAQINIPLLLFAITQLYLIIRYCKRLEIRLKNSRVDFALLILSILLLVFFVMASLIPAIISYLPKHFSYAQFAYRLVSYQDLSILLMIISSFMLFSKFNLNSKAKPVLITALGIFIALSAQSVLIKSVHGNSIVDRNFREEYGFSTGKRNNLLTVPPSMHGLGAYMSTKGMAVLPDHNLPNVLRNVSIPVGQNEAFGKLGYADVYLEKPTVVGINMYPFPWNYLEVNGVRVDQSKTNWANGRVNVKLDAGSYRITSKFKPDSLWVITRRISFFLFFGGVAYSIVYLIISKITVLVSNIRSNYD